MTTPRTINADVFRRARREGLPPNVAAYAARPAVLDLDFLSHFQADGEWADVEHAGRTFRVEIDDAARFDGRCESCAELVDAYRRRDDGIAWLTPEEYDRFEHRIVAVTMLDDEGEQIDGTTTSLGGVCGPRGTEIERLLDDRFIAETALDLITESEHYAAQLVADAEAKAAAHDAERRRIVAELSGVAVAHGARPSDEMGAGFRRALGWND